MVSKLRESCFFLCDRIGQVVKISIQMEVGIRSDIGGHVGSTEGFGPTSGEELAFAGNVRHAVGGLLCHPSFRSRQ